jgi:hypothetical protein
VDDDTERLFYLGTGPLLAVLLGMALAPVRDYTTASNLTFAFLVLTIAVAELGGRWPALATALASALSLDFFLTKPYQRLTIADKHDVIAFFGLGGCGLVAALLGSARRQRIRELSLARKSLALIRSALAQAERSGPLESRLSSLLSASRSTLPIALAVVRDPRERVLAVSPHDRPAGVAPDDVVDADSLGERDASDVVRIRPSRPLNTAGLRLELTFDGDAMGFLDVWGDPSRPADLDARRSIVDLGRIVALLIGAERGARAGTPSPGGASRARASSDTARS